MKRRGRLLDAINHPRDTRHEQIPTRPTNAEQYARVVAA